MIKFSPEELTTAGVHRHRVLSDSPVQFTVNADLNDFKLIQQVDDDSSTKKFLLTFDNANVNAVFNNVFEIMKKHGYMCGEINSKNFLFDSIKPELFIGPKHVKSYKYLESTFNENEDEQDNKIIHSIPFDEFEKLAHANCQYSFLFKWISISKIPKTNTYFPRFIVKHIVAQG